MLRNLVLLQGFYSPGREPYPTATLCRLGQVEGLAIVSQGLSNVQPPVVEVHVVPPKTEQFTPAHPGLDDKHVQSLPPIVPSSLQEEAGLIQVEGRTLLPLGSRRVHSFGHVAGHKFPSDSLLKRRV